LLSGKTKTRREMKSEEEKERREGVRNSVGIYVYIFVNVYM
jgi:hypothetical protein